MLSVFLSGVVHRDAPSFESPLVLMHNNYSAQRNVINKLHAVFLKIILKLFYLLMLHIYLFFNVCVCSVFTLQGACSSSYLLHCIILYSVVRYCVVFN